MAAAKKVTLVSSDGVEHKVDEAVAMESVTIKHMIEDDCADSAIPLPNVTSEILAKVISYLEKHKQAEDTNAAEEDLKTWDADFVKVDQATLFDLIMAANYLNIKSLLDLTCQTVADMIKGKTPEGILKTLNIKKDFTPEEEEKLRRENPWAFEEEKPQKRKFDCFCLNIAMFYQHIKSLFDLMCETVADMIKGKTPKEICKTLNIKKDFTPEEEEKLRRENPWAFEEEKPQKRKV